MKNDHSMDHKGNFLSEQRVGQQKSQTSPKHSHVSMKSDHSMDHKGNFLSEQRRSVQQKRSTTPERNCVSRESDHSMDHKGNFLPDEHRSSLTDKDVLTKLKRHLKVESQRLFFELATHGTSVLLRDIYTDLYVIEGERGDISRSHEVRLIEKTSLPPAKKDTPVKCNDIFKTMPDQQCNFRTVMTKGMAGIGKTVSVQKFITDWAEEVANQDIQLIFPLPFRELNLMREKKLSLLDLLCHFFKEITHLKEISSYKVLFIFDGLDECRLPLNFHKRERCCDVTKSVSVDSLLTNLIKGNLIPSALVWITSRPAAANQIPPVFIDRVTEVRGFNDPQKEEYFQKRFSSQSLANRVITHIKASRSLYIMCHIPVFCWLSAAVLERTLCPEEKREPPNTLTQMYTHFLIIQMNIKNAKYLETKQQHAEMVLKLGKLAFQQLCKGNLIFYEADLKKCGIDLREASVYSGVFTQIFHEEFGLAQKQMFSFVHLSIQEHLAALYVFFCFTKPDQASDPTPELADLIKSSTIDEFHKAAVDMALKSENGHLDLFLRFLLGQSLEYSQRLLQSLLAQSGHSPWCIEESVQYIKEKIREDPTSDRRINLFYCLIELNHHSIVEKIDRNSGTLSIVVLVPEKWSTETLEFHISEEELDQFNLRKYLRNPGEDLKEILCTDEILQRLLPAVKAAQSAKLKNCSLTERSCEALASAFRSNSLKLSKLNLRENKLKDSGIRFLCSGLESPYCELETLELRYCYVGVEGCEALASAFKSGFCRLKELNLRDNKRILDTGVIQLCNGLRSEHCKLEKLLLSGCMLSEKSCSALRSVLSFKSSSLTELELSYNWIQDAGVELLSDGLKSPRCKLEALVLCRCKITERSCAALASALSINANVLKELYLSGNKLQDSGVKELLAFKKSPRYKLEKLIW